MSSRLSGTSEKRRSADGMSKTVTAGDLALVAGAQEFEMMARVSILILQADAAFDENLGPFKT